VRGGAGGAGGEGSAGGTGSAGVRGCESARGRGCEGARARGGHGTWVGISFDQVFLEVLSLSYFGRTGTSDNKSEIWERTKLTRFGLGVYFLPRAFPNLFKEPGLLVNQVHFSTVPFFTSTPVQIKVLKLFHSMTKPALLQLPNSQTVSVHPLLAAPPPLFSAVLSLSPLPPASSLSLPLPSLLSLPLPPSPPSLSLLLLRVTPF
jgi:hypothetical protein